MTKQLTYLAPLFWEENHPDLASHIEVKPAAAVSADLGARRWGATSLVAERHRFLVGASSAVFARRLLTAR